MTERGYQEEKTLAERIAQAVAEAFPEMLFKWRFPPEDEWRCGQLMMIKLKSFNPADGTTKSASFPVHLHEMSWLGEEGIKRQVIGFCKDYFIEEGIPLHERYYLNPPPPDEEAQNRLREMERLALALRLSGRRRDEPGGNPA